MGIGAGGTRRGVRGLRVRGVRGGRGRRSRGVMGGMGGGGLIDGYTTGYNWTNQEAFWNESGETDMYGRKNYVYDVDEIDADEDCVIVENDETGEKREVEMSENRLKISVSGERGGKETSSGEGAGVEGRTEGRQAEGREATAESQAKPSKEGESSPVVQEARQAHTQAHTLETEQAEKQVEPNRPTDNSLNEKLAEERGDENSSAADTASISVGGDEDVSAALEGEKVGEEQTTGGQSQGGLDSAGLGEGKGDNGAKARQRESMAKGARLSLGGKGDAGLSAAQKFVKYKAVERKGGSERGGSEKGSKTVKKDGSGVGSMTTRSQKK